jgi:DNA polymerase
MTQLELDVMPATKSLVELAKAENACTRCPLYQDATQAVPGEGRRHAHLMLVGEQPGDKEDLAGKPFVGPAGQVLDQALAEAEIPRTEVFVTNAVKHFKHEMRGKRRLHKRPNAYEIERCKVWLELEREMVRPAVIVALGASAARSLLGRPVTITKLRGRRLQLSDGTAPWSPSTPRFCCASRMPPTRNGNTPISSPICGWLRRFWQRTRRERRQDTWPDPARRPGAAAHEDVLFVFREPAAHKRCQCVDHLGRLVSARFDGDRRAGTGRQHHQAHDRGPADNLVAALDPHVGVKLFHQLNKLG